MFLETGYVYHIKDEYFEFAKDEKLMKNHENGNTRPTYFCIKNANLTEKILHKLYFRSLLLKVYT